MTRFPSMSAPTERLPQAQGAPRGSRGQGQDLRGTRDRWWRGVGGTAPLLLLLLVLGGNLGHGAEPTAAESLGGRRSFDAAWRFCLGDPPGAQAPDFPDRGWPVLDLPHDFAIAGPFDAKVPGGLTSGFRPLGIGWYRKTFPTPANLEGRRLRLDFTGVYRAPQVWINGVLVHRSLNGFLGFTCDLTPHLRPAGQDNVVAVRADNSVPDTTRWYNGGGINRHVWWVVTGDCHLEPDGIQIRTPVVTADQAQVVVTSRIQAEGGADGWLTLDSALRTADGTVVARGTTVRPFRAGEALAVDQAFTVLRPDRWEPGHPSLYTLVSQLTVEGRITDRVETPVGLRDIQITPEGLFLNGRRLLVTGANLHEDYGCLGTAGLDRAIERRLRLLMSLGVNAVRLSHNPHDPVLLDTCDRLGLLVYAEIFDQWSGQFYGSDHAFAREWPADLTAAIRRDRNHPSVFIWSLGNEVPDGFKPPDYGVQQFTAMRAVARLADPTRPVTTGLFPMRWNGVGKGEARRVATPPPPPQLAFASDVMSANYMERFFREDRQRYPQLAFISSESSTDRLNDGVRESWDALDRDHAVGLFFWGAFNYIGETPFWPVKGWSAGFIDRCGFPRPLASVVQSLFSPAPMVALIAIDPRESVMKEANGLTRPQNRLRRHWTWQPGQTIEVEAVTNADEVEVFQDGLSLGRKRRDPAATATAGRLLWSVPYRPGFLEAVAYQEGREVARDLLRSAGPATALRLIPDRDVLLGDGQDLCHLRVEVVDAQGIQVPDAAHRVTFTVEGPGFNAGVDNGDYVSDEPLVADSRSVWEGRALLVVRTRRQSGALVVTASAPGLVQARRIIPVSAGVSAP